ncbi:VOC family protein [Sporolactobacillus pectinivorans]|uniref:VOC family protein n=1 Tax=Sporolactobacillus pectinivorans TaxID=1591408 RepID=UPI000C265676
MDDVKPVIDHVHVTVSDIERAEAFYDQLMPLFGFHLDDKETDAVPDSEYKIVEYHHRNFSFGIVSPRSVYKNEIVSRRKPRALHHLAFHVNSRDEVKGLYEQVKKIKAEIVQAPRLYPDVVDQRPGKDQDLHV